MNGREKLTVLRKTRAPFKIADLFVYSLLIAAVVLSLVSLARPAGSSLEISFYGADNVKRVITVSLAGEARYRAAMGADGTSECSHATWAPLADSLPRGGEFIVRVESGRAWVEDSKCPNRVCVHSGKIGRVGQSITCSPYRIYLRVGGEADEVVIG